MSDTQHQGNTEPREDAQDFTEPSKETKERNRVTGYIFLAIVLGIVALTMITRAYGG